MATAPAPTPVPAMLPSSPVPVGGQNLTPVPTCIDPLQPLLLLQAFDGSWMLDEPLAIALGISFALLTPDIGVQKAAWATALGLAFLQLHFASREEEWALVAGKARKWLHKMGHDVEILTTRTREKLGQLLGKS